MPETFRIDSPAKVNLRLDILRQREDGYHDLRTIFQKISLKDTVRVSLTRRRGIAVRTDHPGLPPGRKNLAYGAARAILRQAVYRGGVQIDIEKRIPLGAGLGGGSSNAAATLMALNQLLEINLSRAELMALGLSIGADVPFFLLDGSAIAYGIGERLRRLDLPTLWYALIYPNFQVSTRWAYRNFVLTKRQFHINLRRFVRHRNDVVRILGNDLEEVVSKHYPQIGVMKGILDSAGALGSLMTGSGPTVFGIFPNREAAEEGFRKVRDKVRGRRWRVMIAHSLPFRGSEA